MKKWRETKFKKTVKIPKAKKMSGIYNKQDILKEIKIQKEKQRKKLRIIHDELKKAEQFRISLEGLQKLSHSSIKSLQERREKSIFKANKALSELTTITRKLEKTENQFRKAL